MPDMRINNAVKKTGSGYAVAVVVDSAGAYSGAKFTLPWISASSFKDTTEIETIKSEGMPSFYDTGSREVEWELTFMQRDKATVQMMVETHRDHYLQIFKENSDKTVNAKYQYYLAAICKPVPTVEVTNNGNEIKAVFKVMPVTALLTVDCTTFDDTTFKGTITGSLYFGPANKEYWDILEVS